MKLTANHIGFRYYKTDYILRDVSFEIETGESIGIVAPSGYGKSTFSGILCGSLIPQEGEVLLDGVPINKVKGFNPVQIVYQHPEKALNPRWTMGKSLTEAYVPSQERMDAFGIQKRWLTRWPNELSGGELQRFCILRLLSPQVRFLVLDEISTMLDPITQVQIWSAVLDIAKAQNLGLIVISHSESLVERVCDRVFDLTTISFHTAKDPVL